MEQKYDGTHFLVMYLTGYGFFIYQVYVQILYSYHGMSLIIPLIIAALSMPIIVFYVVKKLNNHSTLSPKLQFIFTILNILYLSIVGIFTLNYVSVMVHNYYYQSVKSYIIATFLLLPIVYALFKKSKIYYSLAFILLSVFIIFNLVYTVNHEVAELFPLSNILKIDNEKVLQHLLQDFLYLIFRYYLFQILVYVRMILFIYLFHSFNSRSKIIFYYILHQINKKGNSKHIINSLVNLNISLISIFAFLSLFSCIFLTIFN